MNRQQQIDTAVDRILEERGADLEKQAAIRDLNVMPDPEQHKEAAAEMARELARRGVRSGNFSLSSDYRDVADLGIERARQARINREQEGLAAIPEPSQHQEEAASKLAANIESLGHVAEEVPQQDLIASAVELQQKEQSAAEVWVVDAEGSERQQHQNGRYDNLRHIDPPSLPASGLVGEGQSEWDAWGAHVERNETPEQSGEQNANGRLAAMVATASFEPERTVEPSLLHLMQSQDQSKSGQEKSAESSGLMSDFVTAEINKEVEEAREVEVSQQRQIFTGHTV